MPVIKKASKRQIQKATEMAAKAAEKVASRLKFKVTDFVGYLSGDFECFCLSKVPFEEWWKWHRKHEALTLYPSHFFPEECKKGRWKFTISVQAERVDNNDKDA